MTDLGTHPIPAIRFMEVRLALAAAVVSIAGAACAEPVQIEVPLPGGESIRGDFRDGTNHFVLMVQREGTAEGEGPLAGSEVVEYGWHDVNPPIRATPLGYLEFTTPEGDIAYLKFDVRGTFLGGGESPRLIDRGAWELTSGTGRFENMRGLGTVVITPGDPTTFSLDGELAPMP